jgi:hypothetical protein
VPWLAFLPTHPGPAPLSLRTARRQGRPFGDEGAPSTDIPAAHQQSVGFGKGTRVHHAVRVDGDDHLAGGRGDSGTAGRGQIAMPVADHGGAVTSSDRFGAIAAAIRHDDDLGSPP